MLYVHTYHVCYIFMCVIGKQVYCMCVVRYMHVACVCLFAQEAPSSTISSLCPQLAQTFWGCCSVLCSPFSLLLFSLLCSKATHRAAHMTLVAALWPSSWTLYCRGCSGPKGLWGLRWGPLCWEPSPWITWAVGRSSPDPPPWTYMHIHEYIYSQPRIHNTCSHVCTLSHKHSHGLTHIHELLSQTWAFVSWLVDGLRETEPWICRAGF